MRGRDHMVSATLLFDGTLRWHFAVCVERQSLWVSAVWRIIISAWAATGRLGTAKTQLRGTDVLVSIDFPDPDVNANGAFCVGRLPGLLLQLRRF